MSLPPLISVCIPAYNEESTIRRALESVIAQTFTEPGELEILVGPNGCTDGTVDAVQSVASETTVPITLVEVNGKGKPTAWNQLIAAARADIVCFMDADVELEDGALCALHEELQQDRNLVLVAGKIAARMNECSLLTRLSVPESRNGLFIKRRQDYVCGRLYAVRKSTLLRIMKDYGTNKLPNTVIHEDAWLQRVLDIMAAQMGGHDLEEVIRGVDRLWKVCSNAVVYFVPQDWKEDPYLKVRSLHASGQLRKLFPEYYQAREEVARRAKTDPSRPGRATRFVQLMREIGPWGIVRLVTARAMQDLSWRRARKIFNEGRTDSVNVVSGQWIRSEVSRS